MKFCATLLVFGLVYLNDAKELVFVQAISRHGDRAPTHMPYPNDPYNEKAWPRGWGELTSIGMLQLHELGQFFRHRYSGFLSDSFVVSETYMRSSDKDRALVSAQSFLSGMYPAVGSYQWANGDVWQPTPVHASSPGEDDLLCHSTSIECPNAHTYVNAIEANDSVIFTAQYSDMFDLLKNVTGIPTFSYTDVNRIFDINRELIHNMSALQPSWVLKKWPQYQNRTTLEICSELRKIRFLTAFGSEKAAQFYGGYLLNTWINNALNVANGTQTNPSKLLWFSSHDTVLMSLLYTMGIGNGEMPPYASALVMEIYTNKAEFEVEVFYKNDSSTNPHVLPLPGCGTPCLVSRLPSIYEKQVLRTKTAVKENCGVKVQQCDSSSATGGILTISPIFVILLLSLFVC